MAYREFAAELKQLPLDERLLLMEELMRSLRVELAVTKKPGSGGAPALRRGMLRLAGPMPTDQELQDTYVDYLVEKYL